MAHAGKLSRPFRVDRPKKFRLKDWDPGDTGGLKSEAHAGEDLERGVARLADLQEMLYAENTWALLLIFQAMDAAGKDSTIKHVMSGVNPTGCQVYSFKQPNSEELDHDFMWRTSKCLPERGRIGIFNRSYYEEVLVVRVHPEYLNGQQLSEGLITKRIWDHRLDDIAAFERYVARQGIAIRKFYLNVSRAEQRRRFLARLNEPEKNWKFSIGDLAVRDEWEKYMEAYEEAIRATSTDHAPWYVVPADHKWFMQLVVADAIADAMEEMKLAFPKIDDKRRAELAKAKRMLTAERK